MGEKVHTKQNLRIFTLEYDFEELQMRCMSISILLVKRGYHSYKVLEYESKHYLLNDNQFHKENIQLIPFSIKINFS